MLERRELQAHRKFISFCFCKRYKRASHMATTVNEEAMNFDRLYYNFYIAKSYNYFSSYERNRIWPNRIRNETIQNSEVPDPLPAGSSSNEAMFLCRTVTRLWRL